MKKTRLKDLPKGKRWSHFWHYYSLHVFLTVILGSFALYTFYLVALKPHSDLSVLILSDRFELSCETAMRQELAEQSVLDMNGDGTVRAVLSYVQFSGNEDNLYMETRMELLTLLSVGNIYIFLANEDGYNWLSQHNLLGTWGDLTGVDNDAEFSVPVSELPIFQGEDCAVLQHLSLYIACPPEETQEYDAQMAALRQLIGA